jgi:hypothetical protein
MGRITLRCHDCNREFWIDLTVFVLPGRVCDLCCALRLIIVDAALRYAEYGQPNYSRFAERALEWTFSDGRY